MLPLPRHLKYILRPTGDSNNEFELIGKIVCDCGSENFKIKIVGDSSSYASEKVIKVIEFDDNFYLIIKVECNNCNKEYLIFDNLLHGYNGFVCNGLIVGKDSKSIPRPDAKDWCCDKCGKTNHSMTVKIHSTGQNEFIENAGEEFDKNDWTETFDWITIKTECKSCNETNEEWISYETM